MVPARQAFNCDLAKKERSGAAPLRAIMSICCRCQVGLPVVYLKRGAFYFDLERVELVVGGWWDEGKAVFVAD